MKALLIISASFTLAASLQAMTPYRLETSPSSNGFINTQIGYSDILNKTSPSPIAVPNGNRFDFVQTNSSSTGGGGGFGGSAGPFQRPDIGPVIVGANSLGGFGGDGAQTASLVQPNGPALPVPEPSSSWFLLALALIPILKVRNSRKTRVS